MPWLMQKTNSKPSAAAESEALCEALKGLAEIERGEVFDFDDVIRELEAIVAAADD